MKRLVMQDNINSQGQRSSLILSVIIAIFAIGSWIDVNGLWVELPLIVDELPEYWQLPTYMSVVIQAANIGPITYMLLVWLTKGSKNLERGTIYIILIIGALSCLFLALFWNVKVDVDQPRSIPFLILVFCLALVDCTSSITFLPYMATFPAYYMSAFYIGEGCSGLIPAVMALIQGVGQQRCEIKMFVKPSGAKCTTKWNKKTITNVLSGHKVEADGIPYHIQDVRSVPYLEIQDQSETHLRDVTQDNITEPQNFPVPLQPNFSVEVFMFFLLGMLVLSLTAFLILDCTPRQMFINPDNTNSTTIRFGASHTDRGHTSARSYVDPSVLGTSSTYFTDNDAPTPHRQPQE